MKYHLVGVIQKKLMHSGEQDLTMDVCEEVGWCLTKEKFLKCDFTVHFPLLVDPSESG